MNCEYCKKQFGIKKNGKQYKHINIGQPISIHLFCTKECKTNWCYAVQENILNPNEKTSNLDLNLEDKLVSEIKDLSALEEYLSKPEYKRRYIEILNKEEFKQLNLISEIKEIMSLEV
jgi:hypothetical protein